MQHHHITFHGPFLPERSGNRLDLTAGLAIGIPRFPSCNAAAIMKRDLSSVARSDMSVDTIVACPYLSAKEPLPGGVDHVAGQRHLRRSESCVWFLNARNGARLDEPRTLPGSAS